MIKNTREGKRFTSPGSTMSPYHNGLPLTAERGRLQSTVPVSAVSSYSQQHLLSKSRTASSGTRRALVSGRGASGNVINEYSAASQRPVSVGRRNGSSSCKTRKSVSGVLTSPDMKRVTFMNDRGQFSENSLHLVPPACATDYQCNNNNNNVLISSPEDCNPVQHLLSELVEISQTLATYLQNGGGDFVLQQKRAHSENGNRTSFPQQQQQATLKAQEIERIVKRVEGHFAQKIASMTRKEKEQAEKIAELTAEIHRLQREKQQVSDNGHNYSHLHDSQTFFLEGLSGSTNASCSQQHQDFTVKETGVVASTNNNCGGNDSEADNLRRMLQQEKRQRLFVEEQTQSLTEQHTRVVSTLERRLQKQEEQLRELAASLEHRLPAPVEQAQRVSEASRRGGPSSAQPQTAISMTTHADFSNKASFGISNNCDGDNYGLFGAPGSTKQNFRLSNENDSRRLNKEAQFIFSSDSPLPSSFETNYQRPGEEENRQNGGDMVTNLVDIAAARAVEEVDEITVFLDNISQELESIDAMEGERERQLSVAVGKRIS